MSDPNSVSDKSADEVSQLAKIKEPRTQQVKAAVSLSKTSDVAVAMPQLTDTQRSGSITGIGIALGFSLTFTGQWSLGEGEWHLSQAAAMSVALIGIVSQLWALFGVLRLPAPSSQQHSSVIRKFAFGVILVFLGFIAHVLIDIAIDVLHWHVP